MPRPKYLGLFFFSIFLLFVAQPLIGQNNDAISTKIDQLMRLKPIRVKTHPESNDPLVLFFPMYFSSAEFLPKQQFILPKKKEVLSVHLVYTRYRQVDTFNQPKLNEKRFKHLSEKFPELFINQSIEWRIFEQTKATKEEDARKMFHGFVIFLKDEPDPKVSNSEMGIIDNLISSITDTLIEIPDRTIYRKTKRYVETGRYIPRRSDKVKKGIRYDNSGIWFREAETKLIEDSVKRRTIKGYKTYKGVYTGKPRYIEDIDVYDRLRNRNFKGKWAFVTDVTGSMAPYTGQVMALLQNRPNLATDHYYSFFNDGNGAPEILKRIGNSGGVYTVKTSQFDSIYHTMKRAMLAGSGGDLPENNIEAILRTIKQWPDTDSILMVADALAPIKDIKLINYVNKPVHILLCGDISNIITIDYVYLAKASYGSIITNEGIIDNLHKVKVGQTIEVGDVSYKLTHKGLERL